GGRSFFPGVVPASLSPLLQNSVAVGGFTAFILSTIAYLSPKKGVGGVFKADVSEVAGLQKLLASGRQRLGLTDEMFNILSLCCEEVFCHMAAGGGIGGAPGATAVGEARERTLTLRISKTDEGYFTEMVCGHMMDDINNFALPESLLQADADELSQLGLVLFAQYARNVKHLEISGYSYISFEV
ncbi:MAG TPA: hypothetical protein VN419_04455, partial [Humidesulfovibrio sp.]|uniref:hypothetical protein n=1 Tax=Humidesulfovibrio sp. TaxID=2910988 RepID=UPI002B93DF76